MANSDRNLIVIVCDPKLMRKFKHLANTFRIAYTVPLRLREGEEVAASTVIADSECLERLSVHAKRLFMINENNLVDVILKISGRERIYVLTVGVDIGERLGYVMLADDFLYSKGYAGNIKELIDLVSLANRELNPKNIILKIGDTGLCNKEIAPELFPSELLHKLKIYIVDELRSNQTNVFLNQESKKLTKDLNAALNIALRKGISLSESKSRYLRSKTFNRFIHS